MNSHHVFWSGGPKSTSVIHDILEQGQTVHAHHVRIGAFRQQCDAEYLATQAIATHIYKDFPKYGFTLTVSVVDFSSYAGSLLLNVGAMAAHRAGVLKYCGRLIDQRMFVGTEFVLDTVPLGLGFTKYANGGHVTRLPKYLADLTCRCLLPQISRSHKGDPLSYTTCGNCHGCKA